MTWYWAVSLAVIVVSMVAAGLGTYVTVRGWSSQQWKPRSPTFYLDCAIKILFVGAVAMVLCLVAMVLCIVFL